MKIKYLGSGACEGIPALFCNCDTCIRSRKLGGRNIRSTAQALIDDFLLMDFGPGTQDHFLKYNLSTEQVDTCFVTHNHFDHFVPGFFESAMFSHNYTKKFTIYMPLGSYNDLQREIHEWIGEGRIENQIDYRIIEKSTEVVVKDNYVVHSIKANHDPKSNPVIYSIKNIKEDKQMLYANDTGLLDEESLNEFKKIGGYYNLISVDCTDSLSHLGPKHPHMTWESVQIFFKQLKEMKLIDNNTKIILNHFSHNGKGTYDDLVKLIEKDNIIISYDGLEIEF